MVSGRTAVGGEARHGGDVTAVGRGRTAVRWAALATVIAGIGCDRLVPVPVRPGAFRTRVAARSDAADVPGTGLGEVTGRRVTRGKERAAVVIALVVATFLASGSVGAQTDLGDHTAHHPGAGAAPQPVPAPGPAALGQTGQGCGPGAAMGMMGCMGGPPRPFFSSLLDMPALTPDARRLVSGEAERRIGWGTQAIAAGHARLEAALEADDAAAARLAAQSVRDGVLQVESGTGMLRAVAEGQPPRDLALAWFRDQLSVPAAAAAVDHGGAPWGLSWYHLTTMAALVAALLAALAIQAARTRRIGALMRALTAAPRPPPAVAPQGPAPTAPLTPAEPLPGPAVPAEATPGAPPRLWRGKLRIVAIFPETPDVKTFRLMDPSYGLIPFSFVPGQFLTLTVEADGRRVSRSYTIASPPTRVDHVEITVKREEHGEVSRHLHDATAVGDLIEVAAPGGAFTFTGQEAGDIVLIAGGVGITPMMSVIRTLTDRAWPGEIHLLYGARTTRDFIFRDELEYLQRRHPNLHVAATMRRAEGTSWMGPEGVISKDFIARTVPDIARRRVHLCGPPPMMEAVKAALAEFGVPPANVRTEAFGPARGQAPAPASTAPAVPPPQAQAAPPASTTPAASPLPVPANQQVASATVTFSKSSRAAPLARGQTVLEAAEAAGVAIDYSCRVGICGTCMVPLREGAVTMEVEDGLPPEEKERGMILACQAKSEGDLVVEA
jgi:ferredoxin-NADP reductase